MASRRTGRVSKAKIKVNRQAGEPAIKKLRRAPWPAIRKPMRAIASVRTLRKVDESKGKTMPESKIGLARPGVGTRQQAPSSILSKAKVVATNKNKTVVKTPSKTNNGGVRSPFRKGRGTNP